MLESAEELEVLTAVLADGLGQRGNSRRLDDCGGEGRVLDHLAIVADVTLNLVLIID